MTHDIETIRDAMQRMHRRACDNSERNYMSIPADPKRDADLILSAAIDELEQLRAWAADADANSVANTMARDATERLLMASRDERKAEVSRLTAERDSSREALASVGKDRDRFKAERDAFHAEVERLKAELAARDRDYSGSATVGAMDALKAELAALKTELSEVDDERIYERGLASTLRAQAERLTGENALLTNEVDRLNARIGALT